MKSYVFFVWDKNQKELIKGSGITTLDAVKKNMLDFAGKREDAYLIRIYDGLDLIFEHRCSE